MVGLLFSFAPEQARGKNITDIAMTLKNKEAISLSLSLSLWESKEQNSFNPVGWFDIENGSKGTL